MLPEFAQGRRALWEAVNPHTGRRRIDEAFPAALCKRTSEHEMMVEFINDGTWRIVGGDQFNALVSAGPAGIVFSEWALANPQAWAILAPIRPCEEGNIVGRLYRKAQINQDPGEVIGQRCTAERPGEYADQRNAYLNGGQESPGSFSRLIAF